MVYHKSVGTRIVNAMLTLLENEVAPYWSESGQTDWFMPISFQKTSVPEMQKEKLQTAKCFLMLGGLEGKEHDRAWDYLRYTVAVGVAKSVATGSASRESDFDDCVALTEQIQDFISWDSQQTLTLPAVFDGGSVEIQPENSARLILHFENNPIYDPQILRTEGVYLSVTNFVYHFEKLRTE
jgi:hypothetical protein